jgi:hypothetical protein
MLMLGQAARLAGVGKTTTLAVAAIVAGSILYAIEGTMSGAIPSAAALAFGAWLFFGIANRM